MCAVAWPDADSHSGLFCRGGIGCFALCVFLTTVAFAAAAGAELDLPGRPADAVTGMEFCRRVSAMPRLEREREILAEVMKGNVPRFWRKFVEVPVQRSHAGRTDRVVLLVAPEYLAIGSDEDYFLIPVSPEVAQAIADRIDCVLPTRKIVDEIHRAAPVKLKPARIPPSPAMTSVPVFEEHNETVRRQRAETLAAHPLGTLIAGHKKDVVCTPRLLEDPGKVAIYGWHELDGKRIQPLYLGHTSNWVDYSHGARFVRKSVTVNGNLGSIESVLADPELAGLLSNEGPISAEALRPYPTERR